MMSVSKAGLAWAAAYILASAPAAMAPPSPARPRELSRFESRVEESRRRVPELAPGELQALLESGHDFALIDVREEAEWDEGRIPGALHACKGVLERDIEELVPDPDTLIVLYCGSGPRSLLAGESLQRMGYRRVYALKGGYRAWMALGLPVELDPDGRPPVPEL